MNPRAAFAFYNRGIARDRLDDLPSAVADFTAAVMLQIMLQLMLIMLQIMLQIMLIMLQINAADNAGLGQRRLLPQSRLLAAQACACLPSGSITSGILLRTFELLLHAHTAPCSVPCRYRASDTTSQCGP